MFGEYKESSTDNDPLINPHILFPTPLWHIKAKVEDAADIEEMRKWAYTIEKADKGVVKSNIGTYHSDYNRDFFNIPHLKLLQKKLEFFPKFVFKEWWINVQRKGEYNVTHNHPNCDLSFIWYLTDNYNSLCFSHSNYEMTRTNLYTAFKNVNNLDNYNPFGLNHNIDCKAGDILVFPSDASHFVEQHKKRTPRISLAGNISMEI